MFSADIAETSVEQCKMRYEDMKKKTPDSFIYDAVFLTADVTKVSLFFHYTAVIV